jgi:hypothetical protein
MTLKKKKQLKLKRKKNYLWNEPLEWGISAWLEKLEAGIRQQHAKGAAAWMAHLAE